MPDYLFKGCSNPGHSHYSRHPLTPVKESDVSPTVVGVFALLNNKILPANSNDAKQLIGKTFPVWKQSTNESAINLVLLI